MPETFLNAEEFLERFGLGLSGGSDGSFAELCQLIVEGLVGVGELDDLGLELVDLLFEGVGLVLVLFVMLE
jgi:hypothetical protein